MGAPLDDRCSKHSLLPVNLLQNEVRNILLHIDSGSARRLSGPSQLDSRFCSFFLLQNSYFWQSIFTFIKEEGQTTKCPTNCHLWPQSEDFWKNIHHVKVCIFNSICIVKYFWALDAGPYHHLAGWLFYDKTYPIHKVVSHKTLTMRKDRDRPASVIQCNKKNA